MPSLLRGATCGWRREVFHCLQLTQIFRNFRSLCTIPLQIPSLMPLEMRKVQFLVFTVMAVLSTGYIGWEEYHNPENKGFYATFLAIVPGPFPFLVFPAQAGNHIVLPREGCRRPR